MEHPGELVDVIYNQLLSECCPKKLISETIKSRESNDGSGKIRCYFSFEIIIIIQTTTSSQSSIKTLSVRSWCTIASTPSSLENQL